MHSLGQTSGLDACASIRGVPGEIKAFRNRLKTAGNPTMVVPVATARKLLGVLNAMLSTGTDYRSEQMA